MDRNISNGVTIKADSEMEAYRHPSCASVPVVYPRSNEPLQYRNADELVSLRGARPFSVSGFAF